MPRIPELFDIFFAAELVKKQEEKETAEKPEVVIIINPELPEPIKPTDPFRFVPNAPAQPAPKNPLKYGFIEQ